jgi:hypothetical protein
MANTIYLSAGLPVAKDSGQSPATGVNTVYVSAGLPAEVIAAPFQIDASTGEITIADTTGLAAGQEWEVVVRATDAASATDDATVTVTLAAAAFKVAWARHCNNLIGAGI